MKKKTELEMFGIFFEVEQFSATEGLEILFTKDKIHPTRYLSKCVMVKGNERFDMGVAANINRHLFDRAKIVPPTGVLSALIKLVDSFNFEFLVGWDAVKVPSRFISGARTVSSKGTPSIIAQLIQDGIATKKELEEYYSLEDAFQMLDVMTAKGVNAALANEAAEREREGKRTR